jgi:hypothetical protein
MIEKDRVAFVHRAQIISRRVISHPRPRSLAVRDEIRPRIGRRFLFHEPELFHAWIGKGTLLSLKASRSGDL